MHSNQKFQTRLGLLNRKASVIFSAILFLALLIFVFAITQGCGTNAPTKAAQADKVLITAVNDAVPIIVAKINAGELTQKQCDEFTSGYSVYYAAQMALKKVILAANANPPTATAADITAAQSDLAAKKAPIIALANSVK